MAFPSNMITMKKTVKEEIKSTVDKVLTAVVQDLKITKPSRKTRKAISRAAKALRTDLKAEMKRQIRKATSPSKSRKSKDNVMSAE